MASAARGTLTLAPELDPQEEEAFQASQICQETSRIWTLAWSSAQLPCWECEEVSDGEQEGAEAC